MWYSIVDSSFTSNDGHRYRVAIKSTTAAELEQNVYNWPFVKDEAISITCDGELIIDKLHNTRAVVRFYLPYAQNEEEVISRIFADQNALTICTIFDCDSGYRDDLPLYNGFLDTNEIEVYDDNTGHYVLELVFGDLNPLKRIKASTLGNIFSEEALYSTPLGEFAVHPAYKPIGGLFGLLRSNLMSVGRQAELPSFATRLAGADASLYDVLEVYAEAMAGSIRQSFGVLTLIQAPIDAIRPQHATPINGIVKGVSVAKGKAYNRFVYNLKGASPVIDEHKPRAVTGRYIYYYGNDIPAYISGDGSVYDTSSRYGRIGDHKGGRASWSRDARDSWPIVSKGEVAPVVTVLDKEGYMLGDVNLGDGATLPTTQVAFLADKLKADAKALKGNITALQSASGSQEQVCRVLAMCYELEATYQQLRDVIDLTVGVVMPAHHEGYLSAMREADKWRQAPISTDKPQPSNLQATLSEFSRRCDAYANQSTTQTKLEYTGFGIQKSPTSEWQSNILVGAGASLINWSGKGVGLIQRFKSMIRKGEPIAITISGGNAVSSDKVQELIKNWPDAIKLYIGEEQLRLAMQVTVRAIDPSTHKAVYLVDNFGKDGSRYSRPTEGRKRFEWKSYTNDIQDKLSLWVDLGDAYASSMQGTMYIDQPDNYDTIEVILTGKWLVGIKSSNSRRISDVSYLFERFSGGSDPLTQQRNRFANQFSEYSLVRYISGVKVEQGSDYAYRDRTTEIKLGCDTLHFDEVLDYDTRIGTEMRSASLMYKADGSAVSSLISSTWLQMDYFNYMADITSHEAFTLYSLAWLYGNRYNVVDFSATIRDGYRGFLVGEIKWGKDDLRYFAEHYEWSVQAGKVKVRGRQLPPGDNRQIIKLAKQASDNMWVGNFDTVGGGNTSAKRPGTASGSGRRNNR